MREFGNRFETKSAAEECGGGISSILLQAAGLQAVDVAVLIDRESGGRQLLESKGYRLHTVFGFRELLSYWHAAGHVDDAMMAQVEAFLAQS